jgi:hypothetical protein
MSEHRPTLIFLHIPRTGGTTLKKLPERNYGTDQIFDLYDSDNAAQIRRFAQLPESQRANYKCIKGHLFFGFHKLVPGQSTYVTFLREPIARVQSFYSYVRAHPEHYLHRDLVEQRLGLKELLRHPGTEELCNLQTRMIAGDLENPEQIVDRVALERAKENLRTHFSVTGLTEEFDASLLLLARAQGWPLPLYVKRNASRRAPETIDAKTRDLVREANALDLELYQFGKELFRAQLGHAGESFQSEIRRFKRLNFWVAHVHECLAKLTRSGRRRKGNRGEVVVAPVSKQEGADLRM